MSDKPNVLRDTDNEARTLARTLLRGARSASLAAIEPESGGFPFVSRVLVGMDVDGVPVILISKLSTHTQALLADARASLLTGEPGKGDPLAHPRLTVQCTAEQVARDSEAHTRIRERFVRRHPKSKLYVDFPDFGFFRLSPLRASLNGGFGRAYVLTAEDLLIDTPAIASLAAMEANAIDHMNTDHSDAVQRYAVKLCKAPEGNWKVVGIDAAGLDLADGDQLKRLEFPTPIEDSSNLRAILRELNG
ncbi:MULTISPECIES: HugZ family protein [Ensifer]|uniref:HugZ family protein n=1 Tax=Ensifer adhaerens TaxID=106592 RepID=A0ABY8HCR5_ENSAD|nr:MULTISPECIES: HugZ family protein [Ensifer]ANK73338.1 pyridoxamine 5'-phosphate oxidase [Ensifer adhaerens]KDP76209.1 pyridoxamine 5'-phosphate oxidase [Ensifer adhaerens]KQX26436.1 pyridoxamine 5'-phosphate oxidase [Ensifer sp. Root423]KQZ57270.1 pyridoxamine 5'-phosphate oxidase [Ensifer sp. Root558]MBD9541130.1 HugZ family protein [Ensifer sp. ENS04]